jgi:hypothetical protein
VVERMEGVDSWWEENKKKEKAEDDEDDESDDEVQRLRDVFPRTAQDIAVLLS